jgi:hypothetical protein
MQRLSRILLRLIGGFGVLSTPYIFFKNPDIVELSSVKRYLFLCVSLYTSLAIFYIPTCMDKGWIAENIYSLERYDKAKSYITTGIIFLPSFLYLFIAGFIVLGFNLELSIFILLISYYYFWSLYVIFKEKRHR